MISIIAAMSKNHVIGNNGIIPWKIRGEQKRFRDLTLGKTIIMGRRSFEEIGKPLPNRKTILISSTLQPQDTDCITVHNLSEALSLVKDEDEVFIAGGGRVYEEAIVFSDRLYLTIIDLEVEGDTYFPAFDENIFLKTYEKRISGEIPYTYFTFERILS